MTTPALRIETVSHAFGKVQALRDVSFEVPQGAFTALLGVNGAGKTTLFNLVTRLYDNVSGTIAVCGHDVRRDPGPALARLGVVFQSRALDAGITVRQNLRYHAALHGIPRREADRRGEAVLAQVNLSDRIDAKVATLSGGQQRRAEIARALVHEPSLLLLDEPTVGLDVQSRRDVLDAVRALVDERAVGVLWATHLLDEIAEGDELAVLHRGEILWTGLAEDASEPGEDLSDAFLRLTGLSEDPPQVRPAGRNVASGPPHVAPGGR